MYAGVQGGLGGSSRAVQH